jgi:hypothetical protein
LQPSESVCQVLAETRYIRFSSAAVSFDLERCLVWWHDIDDGSGDQVSNACDGIECGTCAPSFLPLSGTF